MPRPYLTTTRPDAVPAPESAAGRQNGVSEGAPPAVPSPPTESRPTTRTKRSRVKFVVRALVSSSLILTLLSQVEWVELLALRSNLSPLWFIPAFGLMFGTTFLGTVKWQLFLRADGVRISVGRLFQKFLVGVFFSCFLPSSIGGDIYRVVSVGRSAGASKSLASVMMGRITGFFALASIGLVAAWSSRALIDDQRVVWAIGGVLFVVVACFGIATSRRVVCWGNRVLETIRLQRLTRITSGVQDSILTYRRRPGLIGASLLVSGFQQFSMLISVYSMSRMLGLPADFVYFLCFIPVIEAVAAIPVSVFGIGVRDAGYVILFTKVGLSATQCVSLSVFYVAMSLLYASVGGILFLLQRGEAEPA